jgi:hypothetical protein
MYKKIVLGAALFCGLLSTANAKDLVAIDGTYTCVVTDFTKVKNIHASGSFALKQNGSVYTITQLDDNQKPIANDYNIFGMRAENVLSLAYQNIKNPKIFGLEQFTISDNGQTLHGTFVYWDHFNKENLEVCKRI